MAQFIKEILQRTDENMATILQDKSKLSLLGYLEAGCSGNSKTGSCGNDRNGDMKRNGNQSSRSLLSSQENWRCGCIMDRILGQGRLAGPEHLYIKLVYVLSERMDGGVFAIPKIDHLHLNGDIESHLDLHVCKSC